MIEHCFFVFFEEEGESYWDYSDGVFDCGFRENRLDFAPSFLPLRRKMKGKAMSGDDRNELFPVVNETGEVMGCATRGECHDGSKLLHPVVHLHVFDRRGALYLQKRPAWKEIQPGKWDTAVGGHVGYGESVDRALRREAAEELGIHDFIPETLGSYLFESEVERELVHVFRTVYEGEIHPSEELDGGRFWTFESITESFGRGIFTPNFEYEIRRIDILKQKL